MIEVKSVVDQHRFKTVKALYVSEQNMHSKEKMINNCNLHLCKTTLKAHILSKLAGMKSCH